jgi:tricorn protease
MWAGDGRIYFVTDRWGRPNLASMKPDGSDVKRLTTFTDYDVRWPSLGDGKIVYQHKMDIWTYDLASGKNEMVPVRLPSDRLQVRERFVDPMANLRSFALSKDGERIALETRGDVFIARTSKKGFVRRVTESSSSRTQFPAFAPDGKTIAAWTEVEGEQQLLLHAADGSAPPRQVGRCEPGWHAAAAFSPDGKKLAWGDQKYQLVVADVATGAQSVVDKGEFEINRYAWSPDSRYLAYDVALTNLYSQVRIWDSQAKKPFPVTDPMVNAQFPAWDPKGRYLYLLADSYVNPFLDRFEQRFIVDQATLPWVVALQAEVALPFAPRSDADPPKADDKKKEEKEKDEKKAKTGTGATGAPAKPEPPPEPIRIDLDGIAARVVQVPIAPDNYDSLVAVEGKLHFMKRPNRGMMPPGDDPGDDAGGELLTYDFEKEKLSTVASGVRGYELSGNGKVLVYQTKEGFTRVEGGATAAPKDEAAQEARLDLSGLSLRIDPRAEWKQMLHEAWRLQRDFFYDEKMHGVDWNAVWTQYGPLADRISSREELADMFGELQGELSVGHTYHFGGDLRGPKPVGTGLLAADLVPDAATGYWQIKKIYRGDYPDPKMSSPLARADLRVKPGDWLLAVDGRPLQKGEDYLKRLANRAGQEVELTVNTAPKLEGARRIVVKTVGGDTAIRYATWIRETREYVDKKSNGRIGYLHLYDMQGLGLRQFARDYPPQWRKQGLIVDDRWNHGGFVAPMILAHLDRKILAVGGTRYGGGVDTTPSHGFHGYLATLINRQGGSDCETLAQGFKDFKLGPVIGTRTWGGWVGIRGKVLRDGGLVTQPEFGGWDPKGQHWMIEGHGVDPDVELDLGPDGFLGGKDGQLDYAIDYLIKQIEKDPRELPPAPPIVPRPLVTVN